MPETKIIDIKEVESLLEQGKTVKVKTKDGYTRIIKYVKKGVLDTFRVTLKNGFSIKVSREHKFFTNAGWVECKDLIVNKHFILCEDENYSEVLEVNFIGQYKIVDITVDHPEHCYFGNGMLNHNTGKSLIAAHICANTQKQGGLAVYLDTENATADLFWNSLGVNVDDLVIGRYECIEDCFDYIEYIIGYIRKSNKDRLVTIVLDSIAGATTRKEKETDFSQKGFNTAKSIIVSAAMRKITNLIAQQRILLVATNQLRQNMEAGPYGDKWIEPCGKSLSYHSSVKVRLTQIEKLKKEVQGEKVIFGTRVKATVTKNRMGPPFRSSEFDVYFDSGINDYTSWLDGLKKKGIIDKRGSEIKYSGEKITTQEFVNKLNSDKEFKEKVYQEYCSSSIMTYKSPNSTVDDTLIAETDEDSEKFKETD